MNLDLKKPASLLSILVSLTTICITAQLTFFIIHYNVSDLLDSFVQSSLKLDFFHSIIIGPLFNFVLIQLVSYIIFMMWAWFLTKSICKLFNCKQHIENTIGILIWTMNCLFVVMLNGYFYPHSFFAELIPASGPALWVTSFLLLSITLASYIQVLRYKYYVKLALFFVILAGIFSGFTVYDYIILPKTLAANAANKLQNKKPNIIFIGLDSVRPDFTGFFNPQKQTPNIDNFLKSGVTFTHAYTPLARTFPAWMSILTAKYPLHNQARANLANPELSLANDTLAKHMQAAGYETLYATDEKRFSNITAAYGFDRIIGPGIGINDFILGGLNDFPLTNLLINTSLGRILFPFNYANRAAAITYQPENFLQLVQLDLTERSNKPLFLAIHLCISHWPFIWAQDHQAEDLSLPLRYERSVEAVDKQLGQLLTILKENKLLDNTLVVLLSDHGTAVGLLNDRIITEEHYQGEQANLKLLPIFKLSSADKYSINFKKDYSLSTSFGQGTDVLSLKQHHVVLAFQGFGLSIAANQITHAVSLLDIAPTILDYLNYAPLEKIDGISLKSDLLHDTNTTQPPSARALFLETGYSLSDIESKNINVEKVLKKTIGIYKINPQTGQLFVNPAADKAVNENKQRAILWGDWLLARYPATVRQQLQTSSSDKKKIGVRFNYENYIQPAFYVLVNRKTGKWDIGLNNSLAEEAPIETMLEKLKAFYGNEV
jgi:arylsulfatase A-like enzyme